MNQDQVNQAAEYVLTAQNALSSLSALLASVTPNVAASIASSQVTVTPPPDAGSATQ